MKNKLYLIPIALLILLTIGVVIMIVSSPASNSTSLNQVSVNVHSSHLGFFSGQPKTKWFDDGRTMILLDDFSYTDSAGKVWVAEEGTEIDGASIPRFLWTIIGGPFEGPYRNASIVHDAYYVNIRENSDVVHKMFYEACLCGGVRPAKAKLMYWGVWKFGGSWVIGADGKVTKIYKNHLPPSEEEVLKMQKFIEDNDPSLEMLSK